MTHPTIAFIGGGNIASSLIGGLIAGGINARSVIVADPDVNQLERLASRFFVRTETANDRACADADIVVLSVKPQIVAEVAAQIKDCVQSRSPLVLSIAAGIPTTALQAWLGETTAIVRAMPNTPALVGAGASVLYAAPHTTGSHRSTAESIMRAAGLVLWVEEESLMDAATALSGSGPAYFFLMMETLQKAGEQLGLPAGTARLLTIQTAFGAAKMALESQQELSDLRAGVTSRGGTTEAALQVLGERHFPEILIEAVNAAQRRATELADLLGGKP